MSGFFGLGLCFCISSRCYMFSSLCLFFIVCVCVCVFGSVAKEYGTYTVKDREFKPLHGIVVANFLRKLLVFQCVMCIRDFCLSLNPTAATCQSLLPCRHFHRYDAFQGSDITKYYTIQWFLTGS